MFFNTNQTEFISEKQRLIWQFGTHIVPLEVSLADIQDEETREGCTQIYHCIMDILTDMYDHPEEYPYGPRWYVNDYLAWLTHSTAPIKKHNDEYTRYLEKIPQFGFTYDTVLDSWSNERYPLFCEYFPRLIALAKERKKNLGGYAERLDFRLFADKIKLTMADLLRPLSDRDQEFLLEMHHYAISNGFKLQMKNPYNFRYQYKQLYSLELSNNPFRIAIGYRLHNALHVHDQLERFLAVVEEQPDREELIHYIQGGLRVCDGCGGIKKPHERCGKWVDLYGARRLAAMCPPTISKYRRGKTNTAYTVGDLMMLKRMLDIRVMQVDRYIDRYMEEK